MVSRATSGKKIVTDAPLSKPRRVDKNEAFWAAVFIAPMLILVIGLGIYPLYASYYIALYNWTGIGNPTQYVGLRHIESVLHDPYFWSAFQHNIVYTVVLVPVQLTLALGLAFILNHPKMRFKTLYRTIFFLPIVTSVAVVAVVIRMMLSNFGTQISGVLGFDPPVDPLANPTLAMLSVIAFGIWQSFGYNLLFFLSALQTVPEELYDAAKVDGANGWQQVLYVTLPSIRPVAVIILVLALLGSMRVFEQSFVLTRGGPFFASEVVGGYIYRFAFPMQGAFNQPNLGYASAAALVFNSIMLIGTLIQYFVVRRMRRVNNNV